jgi:hypothetical protein
MMKTAATLLAFGLALYLYSSRNRLMSWHRKPSECDN